MPYTIGRLAEDGFKFDGREKHCTQCGAWMYRFRDGIGIVHWFSKTSNAEDSVYEEHAMKVCDARRAQRNR